MKDCGEKGPRTIRFRFLSRFLLLLFILLVATVSWAGNEEGSSSPGMEKSAGNNWLFVIGIDAYTSWPKLKTAVNDAQAVRDVLLSQYYFDREHTIELFDTEATRKNILNTFVRLAKTLKPEDSLLIFYAGHGQIDPITGSGSWVPVESGTDDPTAWVNNHEIKNYLNINAIKARHVFLVSDSCFSGDFFQGTRGRLPSIDNIVIKKAYRLDSRQALTSGGVEPVTDAGFGGNSVFSHFFVNALKNNSKAFLVASELYPAVKAGVAQNAAQLPSFGALYGVGGQEGGEYVFFLKRENRLQSLAVDEVARKKELERLKRLEDDAAQVKQREQDEIRRKESELAALDAQIIQMRNRIGTAAATGKDSLKNMLAMVREKEEQANRLAAMKKQREEEERKRQGEIDKLKLDQRLTDLKAFEEISASEYGRDIVDKAWQSLVEKYPEAKKVKVGDTKAFREVVLGIRTMVDKYTGMDFIFVKGGCFQMGDSFGDGAVDERPLHEVCVNDLYVGKYEVTQGEWKKIMGKNPSQYKRGDQYPVEQVTWNDVQSFISLLNMVSGEKYRLPTEAEWEYSARSRGKGQRYAGFSELSEMATYANVCDDSCTFNWKMAAVKDGFRETSPVGHYEPNDLGLYDVTGNVWEWCSDAYGADYYSYSKRDNPAGVEDGQHKVFRGGSWANEPISGRTANRVGFPPDKTGFDVGFRLVLSAER